LRDDSWCLPQITKDGPCIWKVVWIPIYASILRRQRLGNSEPNRIHDQTSIAGRSGNQRSRCHGTPHLKNDTRWPERGYLNGKHRLRASQACRKDPRPWNVEITRHSRQHWLHLASPAARTFAEKQERVALPQPFARHVDRLSRGASDVSAAQHRFA
jgi:hypothetical protein